MVSDRWTCNVMAKMKKTSPGQNVGLAPGGTQTAAAAAHVPRSGCHGRKSHFRSYSPGNRRRRSLSTSPMSHWCRHTGSRSHDFTKEANSHGRGADVRANPDPSTRVGVFSLSLCTAECDLREVFSGWGQRGVRPAHRLLPWLCRETRDDSKEAMERANGMELHGMCIRVDYSITKRPHAPTPGIYMGRATHSGGGSGSSSKRRDYVCGYDRYDEHDCRCSRRHPPSPYCSRYRSRSYSPRRY